MKQNMGRLIRYILIIHKLSGHREYIPGDELISYLNLQMELRGYETLEKKGDSILSSFRIASTKTSDK